VRVACPACGKTYRVTEQQLQRRVVCKECGHAFLLADGRVEENAGVVVPPLPESSGAGSPVVPDLRHRGTSDKEGFFSHLFDFSFSRFVAIRLVSACYILAMLGCACVFVAIAVVGISRGGWGVIFGPLLGLLASLVCLLYARLRLEWIAVLFRIAENTKATAERLAAIAEREERERG